MKFMFKTKITTKIFGNSFKANLLLPTLKSSIFILLPNIISLEPESYLNNA